MNCKKLQEQFDNRLTLIKQLPRGTIRDIDERNKQFATFKMDFHNFFGEKKQIPNLDEVQEEIDEIFSENQTSFQIDYTQAESKATNAVLNTKNEYVTHEDVKVEFDKQDTAYGLERSYHLSNRDK